MDETADIIAAHLVDCANLVDFRLAAFLEDPNDIETNHKLRVSIRTLRSLIDFMSPWEKRKQNERVQQSLKQVVKKTSRLRELDVLASMAESFEAGTPEFREFCLHAAALERERVYEKLSNEKTRRKVHNATSEVRDFQWKKSVLQEGLSAEDVRDKFDELVEGLQRDLDEPDMEDYEVVHSVRKRAKQVRYVSEQFGDMLGADAVSIAKRMKAQQDHLGALCDANVNREIIADFLKREDITASLRTTLESFSASF